MFPLQKVFGLNVSRKKKQNFSKLSKLKLFLRTSEYRLFYVRLQKHTNRKKSAYITKLREIMFAYI